MERLCEHCGEPFIPKRVDAAYCGHSCRQLAYLARKEGAPSNSISAIEASGVGPAHEIAIDNPETRQVALEKASNSGGNDVLSVKNEPKDEVKQGDYFSQYLDYINQLIAYRQREVFLTAFEIHYPVLSRWVNTRYLCLVESVLAVSEKRSTDLDDLKDISNAFYLLLDSGQFRTMPVNYPYAGEIEKYYHIIRQFCLNASEEVVRIKLTRSTKAELIASRFELARMVPRIGFDQLDFGQ